MSTLVIVDMQPSFRASTGKRCLRGVCSLARKFRREGKPIVVLEYIGHGPTHERLQKLLKGYDKAVYVPKAMDDGSSELLDECKRRGFDTSEFYVCGVNLHACVWRTVVGLTTKLPEAIIHFCREAVNCWVPFDEQPYGDIKLSDIDQTVMRWQEHNANWRLFSMSPRRRSAA